jgi:hypothetical protein
VMRGNNDSADVLRHFTGAIGSDHWKRQNSRRFPEGAFIGAADPNCPSRSERSESKRAGQFYADQPADRPTATNYRPSGS